MKHWVPEKEPADGLYAREDGLWDIQRSWPLALFLVSMALGVAARISAGWALPFWFDETVTGTIAGQPTIEGLAQWCLIELTGPGFYGPMWLWAQVAGTSNSALRAPALVLSVAGALLLAWRGHRDRDIRLFWATMALLWLPILPMASEARAYPQLFLLACLQAILFLRIVDTPCGKLALGWGAVTALAGFTHYYSLVIGGFQGLALLLAHRREALRLWPAAIPFVPLAAWMAFHLPALIHFAAGRVQHYAPVPLTTAPFFPVLVFGFGIQGFVVLALLIVTRRHWWSGTPKLSPEALLVLTGMAAFTSLFIAGLIQATLQPRYLTSAAPALLFGIAWWAAKIRARNLLAVSAAFIALITPMVATLVTGAQDPRFRERRHYEFETASTWLAQQSPTQLTFLWSTATAAQADASKLADVAGFFFRRAGRPVEVTVVRGGADLNEDVLAAARRTGSTAILWISDDPLPKGVVAEVDRRDPRWECRDFGGEGILAYACRLNAAEAGGPSAAR